MRLSKTSYPSTDEWRDAIAHDWFPFFRRFDIQPLLIPNSLEDPVGYVASIGVNRLLLTGGDSLSASVNECVSPAPTLRDNTESLLLDWSISNNIPTFGVCRGMQFINTYFGGGLTRDLSSVVSNEIHVDCHHFVQFVSGEFLGCKYLVNSYHDDGVLVDQISKSLDILAQTQAGVVEALCHPHLPITAIQWHPERPSPSMTLDTSLFRSWLATQ